MPPFETKLARATRELAEAQAALAVVKADDALMKRIADAEAKLKAAEKLSEAAGVCVEQAEAKARKRQGLLSRNGNPTRKAIARVQKVVGWSFKKRRLLQPLNRRYGDVYAEAIQQWARGQLAVDPEVKRAQAAYEKVKRQEDEARGLRYDTREPLAYAETQVGRAESRVAEYTREQSNRRAKREAVEPAYAKEIAQARAILREIEAGSRKVP